MKRRFYIFLLGLLLSVTFAMPQAGAQSIEDAPQMAYRQTFMANPAYSEMAYKALRDKPPRFDFMKFRVFYSNTRQYDPIGEETLKQMNDLAYMVLTETDPEKAKGALFAYQTVVSNHLANLAVVMQALSLAKQDKRFGKISFFEWVAEGLVNTVVISGDGYTLQGAYDVVTSAEETVLFERLKLKPLETKSVKEGIIYYNMYEAQDLLTGEKRTVFINTTIPMKYLDALREIQGDTLKFDIRRQ